MRSIDRDQVRRYCRQTHRTRNMTVANLTSDSSQTTWVEKAVKYIPVVSVIIYSLICVLGTLGNGLVIYVTGFRMKRTVNSVWFLNLALADFLFTAFLIFTIVSTSREHQWQFGQLVCKLNSFVSVLSMFTSIFLLMAISLDRCLSIWVVVWAQNKRTVRKAQLIAVAVWALAVACGIPYANFRITLQHGSKTYCAYVPGAPLWSLAIFRFIMGFLIPFLVICVSYVAIGVRARRLQRTRRHRSNRIIFTIVLAFFICWLPFHIIHFIELNSRTRRDLQTVVRCLSTITVCLAFMNSCLNPILYVFMCDEFQKKLKQSICAVLESALAEDHLSFMSSRSLSSHLSRISRKSESSAAPERKGTAASLTFTECKAATVDERDTLSTE